MANPAEEAEGAEDGAAKFSSHVKEIQVTYEHLVYLEAQLAKMRDAGNLGPKAGEIYQAQVTCHSNKQKKDRNKKKEKRKQHYREKRGNVPQ